MLLAKPKDVCGPSIYSIRGSNEKVTKWVAIFTPTLKDALSHPLILSFSIQTVSQKVIKIPLKGSQTHPSIQAIGRRVKLKDYPTKLYRLHLLSPSFLRTPFSTSVSSSRCNVFSLQSLITELRSVTLMLFLSFTTLRIVSLLSL